MLAPVAYLLCELKSRDFYSRMLIAERLTASGYNVVIGQLWAILGAIGSPCLPPGTLLFASANPIQAREMRRVRALGCSVVACDEEALPLAGKQMLANAAPDILGSCDLFCANSEQHKHELGGGEAIRVTGSARIARLLSLQIGRPNVDGYILFNTGFGLINSIWGDIPKAAILTSKSAGIDIETPEGVAEVNQRIAAENANFQLTVDLMKWALESTPHPIVIRPHPSENSLTWVNLTAGNPRISVVPKSDPMPWIKHARVLIHSDSTTGLEGALLGTPCVNLSSGDAWSSRFIVRDVNVTVGSKSAAVDALLDALQGRQKQPPVSLPLSGASEIAKVLSSLLPAPGPVDLMTWLPAEPRPQSQVDKISISSAEMPSHATQLTDSVFVLSPH